MLQTKRWYPMLQTPTYISKLGDFESFDVLHDAQLYVKNAIDNPDDDLKEVVHTWTMVYIQEAMTTTVVPTKGVVQYFIERKPESHSNISESSVLLTHYFPTRKEAGDLCRNLNRTHGRAYTYTVVKKTFTD